VRVIGTAGHVDHGKSSLVLALSGIDPDRLPEEQAREMTIDLGFAWLSLPSGESVGIIDVPGHIDFIRNMLAGIGGIDAALFVVAADEGVMPQTREHLAILDLLRVNAGVVALTKTDLAQEPGWLDLVQEDVSGLLESTVLKSAPIVPVSVRSGQGLTELAEALETVLDDLPPRKDVSQPRLPIDRVFSVAGFGTVVTGTLVDGSLSAGDEVELLPGGQRARIRGLQTHQQVLQQAQAGSRVAINLSGVHTDQIQRGQVVSLPGLLRPTQLVDVHVRVLPQAAVPLKHNQEVVLFSGSAEVLARTRLLDSDIILPGSEGWVQLRLRSPIPVAAGDRFILRLPSPSYTIGGGSIINPNPRRRHKRFSETIIDRLETLAIGQPEDILLDSLRTAEPIGARDLVTSSQLGKEGASSALGDLLSSASVMVLGEQGSLVAQAVAKNQNLVSRGGWASLTQRLEAALLEYHNNYPLRLGMPREELKSRLQPRQPWSGRLFNEVISKSHSEGRVAERDGFIHHSEHRVTFTEDQQARVDALMSRFALSRHAPPSVGEAVAEVGVELFQALVDAGALTRIDDSIVFESSVYDLMVERIVGRLKAEGDITVSQVRDMFGTSRKFVLPLMEYLDEQRLTRRVGDSRVLR